MGTRTAPHACLRQGYKGHEIEQKYGEVSIRIFRQIYGQGFAPAFCASHGLRHTLAIMDRPSLDKLLADEKNGSLDDKVAMALERDADSMQASASGMVLRTVT